MQKPNKVREWHRERESVGNSPELRKERERGKGGDRSPSKLTSRPNCLFDWNLSSSSFVGKHLTVYMVLWFYCNFLETLRSFELSILIYLRKSPSNLAKLLLICEEKSILVILFSAEKTFIPKLNILGV
ncbi:LOW QUALITY PROTEIN: uncharacterized protein LOC9307907 [Arabidopsis lyrata subsp. lyrata]|uniref:LOW QUALITY PROTEIN: uncharacterized protein LOC9307907 n=1 Tax=Arabidopsis lyrata subsp. lyrata TaxID=81972 RepID=UPI000A29C5EA|nr:LOW QUALITY PROTEIN: uncharacterized protein LOC9307907 [Arabidopsis lyrata subsp. lyrata]|eukprot:XP_002873913.2 LOW QUALITY PROTEIN: uncharacterized protein LOC9307907 [Arabidopsis lyrata subsp. lyrata]